HGWNIDKFKKIDFDFLSVFNLCSIRGQDPSACGRDPQGQLTVISSLILENSPCLIPLTFMTSSMVLNGRPSMMARDLTGPMPGRSWSSSRVALFRFT